MSTTSTEAPRAGVSSLGDHWVLFLIEGVSLVVLGTVAILAPIIASLAATIFFGAILLVGGSASLIATLTAGRMPGFAWSLLSALFAIAAGVLLLWWPVQGTVSLTVVLIAFLLVDGTVTILYGLDHRRALPRHWGWMLASGILDILLGLLLMLVLPRAAAWAIGLLVGIDLIFGGWALIVMVLQARRLRAVSGPNRTVAA